MSWTAAVAFGVCLLQAVRIRPTISAKLQAEVEDTESVGYFWHLADLHWDPTYAGSVNSSGVSCGKDAPPSAGLGTFGDYACDSPWKLIESSIDAMQRIRSDIDFVVWTGDDTPHNADLNQDQVAAIISNLTDRLRQSFWNDSLPIYTVLGNHDWSPKHQLTPHSHPLYDRVADMWSPRLMAFDATAQATFRKSGYYKLQLNRHLLIVGLNSNLYYKNDKLTGSIPDPGDQFQWLNGTLADARINGKKVLLIGHVPPGVFEKHLNYSWYYPQFNRMFIELLRENSDVIGSAFFAHHHTDTFRIVRNETGTALTSFLIAPAVTPWETTLVDVMGGAGNNPCVRLVKYNRQLGHVIDIEQYYLNLTAANAIKAANWTLEYRFTEYFRSVDVTTASLDLLAGQLWTDADQFTRYYQINNAHYPRSGDTGTGNTAKKWTNVERAVQYCAVSNVDYNKYDECMKQYNPSVGGGATLFDHAYIVVVGLISVVSTLVWMRFA